MKTILIPLMILLLMLAGCSEEKTAKAPEQPVHETAATTATQTVKETVDHAVDTVKEKAEQVVDAGKEVASEAVETVETAAKEVASDVTQVAETAGEKVSAVTDAATEKGSAMLSEVTETAHEAVSGTHESAQTAVEGVTEQAAEKVEETTAAITPPETVVIENNYGNVTLPHAFHGKTFGCPTCHGDNTPGPFELGKATAHVLCKDCHKEKNGPTKCGGCHKK